MSNITSNLPNNGYEIRKCGNLIINGVCSNLNCPEKINYDNGYRAKAQTEKYPIIEIEE